MRRAAHRVAIAGAAALLIAGLGGCQLMAMIVYVVAPEKIRAQHELQDVVMLVLVDDPYGKLGNPIFTGVIANRTGMAPLASRKLSALGMCDSKSRCPGAAGTRISSSTRYMPLPLDSIDEPGRAFPGPKPVYGEYFCDFRVEVLA